MKKKGKKDLDKATRASVKKEMAKPRMAKSVREAKTNPRWAMKEQAARVSANIRVNQKSK
jgi:hypothetical protein